MINKSFLINQVGSISHYSEKHNMYLEPWCDWKEIEGRALCWSCSARIPVSYGDCWYYFYEAKGGCSDYDYLPFFKVEYFRITPLGKYVLGVTDTSMWLREEGHIFRAYKNRLLFFIVKSALMVKYIHRKNLCIVR